MKIRLLNSNELQQAADLSDLVFGKPGQPSMGKSFPALFHPGVSHSYGAFTDEGELVAFMGLAPDVVRIGEARLNVFSIGSVCTHPDFRGQNLASTLLAECMDHARRSGASLVFVSGGRSLYRRAGCYDFGRVHYAMLDRSSAAAFCNRIQMNGASALCGRRIRSASPRSSPALPRPMSRAPHSCSRCWAAAPSRTSP